MKKLINIFLIIVAMGIIAPAYAQPDNDADPALASFGFVASPITVGNTTKLQLNVTNNAFTYSVPAGAIAILISLPVSNSYTANPTSIAAISGTFASNFTWTYTLNGSTNAFRGVLNTAIPAGTGGIIEFTVKGIANTNGSQVLSTANIQRLNPGMIPNEDVTNNLLSAGLAVAPSPLPVGLLSCTATKNECAARVAWITANEQNTSLFEVEASTDGKAFKTVGNVKAAGNSTEKQYYSFSYDMQSGLEYMFRVKMVDLNGDYAYTPVMKLSCGDIVKTEVTVLPNPVVNIARVSGMGSGKNVISILDVKGAKIQTLSTEQGATDVDVTNLTPGVYTIRIEQSNGDVFTKKLLKQ